jgi:hypothetical protein
MSLAEARAIVQGGSRLASTPEETFRRSVSMLGEDPPPWPTGGGGSGDVPAGFDEDTFGKNPDNNLPVGWVVNPATGGLIPPGGGEVQGPDDEVDIGELFQAGDTVYRWSGTSITKATAAETRAFLNGDATGAGGGSFDTGPGYLSLAQRERAFYENTEFPFERDVALRQLAMEQEAADRGELGNRAGAGLSLAQLIQAEADAAYQRAADPGNFPALLAAQAGITPRAGSPLTQLLGEGFQVQAENPLADPRYQRLVGGLYDYSGAMNADVDAVRRAYAEDPARAADFFRRVTENERNAPAMLADGGTIYATRPKRLQDLATGRTDAIVGEGGTERVDVTPLRGNDFAPPRYLQRLASGETGGMAAAAADPATYTPAQGTWTALGKALAPLGFVPRVVMQRLGAGEAITPNMLGSWIDRLSPSQRALLLAATKSQLGRAGLDDYLFEAQRYDLGGFDNARAGGVYR